MPKKPQNTKPLDNPDFTDDQWRFIAAALANPEKKKSEISEYIGVSNNTTSKWKKVHVYIADFLRNKARHAEYLYEQVLYEAVMVQRALLGSEDENIRLSASKEIIERVLGKAESKQQVEHSGGIQVNWQEPNFDDD